MYVTAAAQTVRFAQRQFLYARHVLDGHLGRHCAVCNDTEKKSLFMLIYAPLLFFAYKGTIYNLVTKTFY